MAQFIIGLLLGIGIGTWFGIFLAKRKQQKNKKK